MLPFALALALAADPAAAPLFVAHSADPTPKVGTLTALAADFSAALAEPAAGVPAGELVSLRRADKPLPPTPATAHVRLANGDVIRAGTITTDDDTTLTVGAKLGGGKEQPLAVPLTALSAVWFTDPSADTPADPAGYGWFDPAAKRDALLLKNGDVVRGAVDKLSGGEAGTVRFTPAGEKAATTYPRSAVAALAFDPALARVRKPKAAYARVTTADGSRVGVSAVSADGKTLTATTLTGGKLSLPLADVMAVDVFGGKAVYLSDLKPKGATHEPFGAVAWPWQADKSAKGNPLRLTTDRGEGVYAKGLGLHSKTTLTYDLGGKYRRFEAVVGLDAASGKRGAADVRVLVDGKAAKEVKGLTAAGGVTVLLIDVAKAKELTLVVDYGPGGDVQDDVNFADARLVE